MELEQLQAATQEEMKTMVAIPQHELSSHPYPRLPLILVPFDLSKLSFFLQELPFPYGSGPKKTLRKYILHTGMGSAPFLIARGVLATLRQLQDLSEILELAVAMQMALLETFVLLALASRMQPCLKKSKKEEGDQS